jgi:hypothetical protein
MTVIDCARCKHPFSEHTKDMREGRFTSDYPQKDERPFNIYAGKPVGESGCTVDGCTCEEYTQR